jgi:hypothetical protein
VEPLWRGQHCNRQQDSPYLEVRAVAEAARGVSSTRPNSTTKDCHRALLDSLHALAMWGSGSTVRPRVVAHLLVRSCQA